MRAEVRGRGRSWRVWYVNETALASPVPVYDREGVLTDVVWVGAPDKEPLTEAHEEFASIQDAEEYARGLGATEVSIRRTLTQAESLARARAVRREVTEGD